MQSGTRSSRPELHAVTVQVPKSPKARAIQSWSTVTCFRMYGSPSITTRSKVAPDFESPATIGVRDVAPASSSSTEPATGRGVSAHLRCVMALPRTGQAELGADVRGRVVAADA